jgi:MFS-type transporter involved in bile tolerance (Atg22 family)
VQETFGVKFFGSILGIVNMTTVVAVVSAPLMVGGMYDALGDYRMAFLSVAGVFTIGALALLGARPPKAKAA